MAEFEIKYKKSNSYKMVPVNGVWGGLDGKGNITCEFFVEKVDHPESTQLIVDEKSRAVTESYVKRKTTDGIVREFQVGMTLEPHLAKTIGEWLINKVDEFEKIKRSVTK